MFSGVFLVFPPLVYNFLTKVELSLPISAGSVAGLMSTLFSFLFLQLTLRVGSYHLKFLIFAALSLNFLNSGSRSS